LTTVSGPSRVTLCQRLGKSWHDLAEYLGIPPHERSRFEPGHECYETLEWLENRGQTSVLPGALAFLGRKDLLPLLLDPDECPAPPSPQTGWRQDRSPYPGLNYFTEADAPIFFGRDVEIADLLNRLADPHCRFIAVIGASGSGKSSLVAAGVLPHLRKTAWGQHWIPLRFTPGELGIDPFTPLLAQLKPWLEKHRLHPRDAGDRLRARGDLGTRVQEILKHEADDAELLLFIDQFEELLTVTAPEFQPRFIVMLAEAARAERIRTLVTLRADFFSPCLAYDELKGLLNTGAYTLAAPEPRAQMAMITGPAGVTGLTLEGDLPWRILDDTGREPGALALMAYTLSLLWERRQDGKLTPTAYASFGGVQGAIQAQAEQAYARLDEAAKDALGTVFLELVEVDPERVVPTRKRALLKDFAGSPAASRLIEIFSGQGARLLVCDQGVVEVAHEALLTHWPRLNAWIQQRFDDFRLLRQLVEQMCCHLEPKLSRTERAFIRAENDRLLKGLRNPATQHKERTKIDDRLAESGDPRPGVDLRDDGLADIV
jgi:hypothetical protein